MSNISWHSINVKLSFFLLASFALCSPTVAEPARGAVFRAEARTQIWLASGFRSYHFKREAGYNEQNTGLGVEIRFDDQNTIAAGSYYNSMRITSHYAHYAWTPVQWGPLRIGGAAGMVNGYPDLRRGKLAFTLIPVAAADFRILSQHAGINLVYIPTIAERVDGSVALQFRIRLH